MGPHHHRKKDGSNSNSSRTSPSKLDDSEFFKNSLLDPMNGDEEGRSLFLFVLIVINFVCHQNSIASVE